MAIPLPVTKTVIQTGLWGVPITNEVNRLTTLTAPGAWATVTYTNGWLGYSGGRHIQVRKRGDFYDCKGICYGGTIGSAMFKLPGTISVDASFGTNIGGANGFVTINTDGSVICSAGSNAYVYCNFSVPIT